MNLRTFSITVLIAFALYFTYGQFSLPWLSVLPVIFALSICSLPGSRFFARHEATLWLFLILFFLGASALSLLPSFELLRSIIVDVASVSDLPIMRWLFIAAAAFVIALFFASEFRRHRLQMVLFAGAAASLLICFALIIPTSPSPQIDVWTVHEEGAQAFIELKNPYTHDYKNIYAEELRPILTPGGVTYSYLPGTFLWMAPWKALGLDTRYSQLLTRLITCALLFLMAWRARQQLDFIAFVPSLLSLAFPLNTFFIVRGWNDDISVMCYALAAWALASRRPWAFFLACNFLLVLKQHVIFFVPLLIWFAWRQFGERLWKTILKSVGVSALILGAYLIADWRNFLGSLYGLTFLKFPGVAHVFPDRRDPFSLMNYLHLFVGYKNSWVFPLIMLLIAIMIIKNLWAAPRVAPFLRGLAAMAFALFIFAPVAFANYYGFAWGLLVIAFSTSLSSAAQPVPREKTWEIKTDWWMIGYVSSRAVILFCFSNLILETRYFHSVADLIAADRWPYADFNFEFLPLSLIPTEIPKLLQDAGALAGFLTYHTLFVLTVLIFDIFIAALVFRRFRSGKTSSGALSLFIFAPLFLAPLYLASASLVTVAFSWLLLIGLGGLPRVQRLTQRLAAHPRRIYFGCLAVVVLMSLVLVSASTLFEINFHFDPLASPTSILIWTVSLMPLLPFVSSLEKKTWMARASVGSLFLCLALTFYLLCMIEAVVDQRSGFAELVFVRNTFIVAFAVLFAAQLYRSKVLGE